MVRPDGEHQESAARGKAPEPNGDPGTAAVRTLVTSGQMTPDAADRVLVDG
jgi:hypothetical protein